MSLSVVCRQSSIFKAIIIVVVVVVVVLSAIDFSRIQRCA
jgi:hypothetical protein